MRNTTTFDLVLLTALVAGLIYFSVDALFGSSGVGKMQALQGELIAEHAELETLEAERDRLATKVDGLSGAEVDRELLDERLRATFGVGGPDEVLLLPPPVAPR